MKSIESAIPDYYFLIFRHNQVLSYSRPMHDLIGSLTWGFFPIIARMN